MSICVYIRYVCTAGIIGCHKRLILIPDVTSSRVLDTSAFLYQQRRPHQSRQTHQQQQHICRQMAPWSFIKWHLIKVFCICHCSTSICMPRPNARTKLNFSALGELFLSTCRLCCVHMRHAATHIRAWERTREQASDSCCWRCQITHCFLGLRPLPLPFNGRSSLQLINLLLNLVDGRARA